MMKWHELVMVVSKLMIWSLSVLVIYWILLKLTGHSPTTDQVIITLLGILCAGFIAFVIYLIRFTNEVSRHMGIVRQHMKESDRRFFTLAKDFKLHLEKGH